MSDSKFKNVYVGKRYVPKIYSKEQWDINDSYEALTIVVHKGGSYTSKKDVPIGIDIDDGEYWVVTGDYDAQVNQYRGEVKDLKVATESEFANVNDKLDKRTIEDGKGVNIGLLGVKQNDVDVQLLKNILEGGGSFYFPSGVYQFRDNIEINLTEDTNLNGTNVVFKNYNVDHVESFIKINTNGKEFNSYGISYDATEKANKNLDIINNHTTPINIEIMYGYAINCRRISSFLGGDNIRVTGNVNVAKIEMHVKGSYGSAGSHVSGSQGVTGITATHIAGDNDKYVRKLIVVNSDVFNVVGSGYGNQDQDGIRHLAPEGVFSETIVKNTNVGNTGGRIIKSQTSLLDVENVKVNQDEGYNGAVIENQRGSLKANNITYELWDNQQYLLRFGGNSYRKSDCEVNTIIANPKKDNLKITNIVHFNSTKTLNNIGNISINNVISKIESDYLLQIVIGAESISTDIDVEISNIVANISEFALYTFSNREENLLSVYPSFDNITNLMEGRQLYNSNVYSKITPKSITNINGFKERYLTSVKTMDIIEGARHSSNYPFGGSTVYKVYDINVGQEIDLELDNLIGSGFKVELFAHVLRGYGSAYFRGSVSEIIHQFEQTILNFSTNEVLDNKLNFIVNDGKIKLINNHTSNLNVMVKIESFY